MTRFRNQSEETEDYGITTQSTPDRFAVRELFALATVGVRQGSEAGPDNRGPNRTIRTWSRSVRWYSSGFRASQCERRTQADHRLLRRAQADPGYPGWWHRLCRTAGPQAGRGQGQAVRAADQPAWPHLCRPERPGWSQWPWQPGRRSSHLWSRPDQLPAGRRSGSSRGSHDLDRQQGCSLHQGIRAQARWLRRWRRLQDRQQVCRAGPGTVLWSAEADHCNAEGSGRSCHGGQRLPWWRLLQRRHPLQEVHLRRDEGCRPEQDHPGWLGRHAATLLRLCLGAECQRHQQLLQPRDPGQSPGHHRLQGAAGWRGRRSAGRTDQQAVGRSQAARPDGQGSQPPRPDRRLRLALVHRPTAALAADRVPRFCPELGCGHHHADPAGARHHVPADQGPVHLHGQDAYAAAQDCCPARALRRRSSEDVSGHDGAVQEGEGQPAGWLSADPGPDADLHRPVLGTDGIRWAASRAVRPVDHRPVSEGPLLRAANPHGCLHVVSAEDEPDHHYRPDAAESDAVHADHLHFHVPLVPGRSDPVLAGEQRHLHHPADHHLPSAGEERPALTQLMRSQSFLMTKEAAFGPPFLLQCPPPSYSFSQQTSQARWLQIRSWPRPPPPAVAASA